tara:strand:- start:2548 stop:2733 length:186 start_codon:yes stop_codon:yes gene_type:complete
MKGHKWNNFLRRFRVKTKESGKIYSRKKERYETSREEDYDEQTGVELCDSSETLNGDLTDR